MLFFIVFYYYYYYLLKLYWCIITKFWPKCAPRQTSTVNLEFLDYNHNIYLKKLYFNIFLPAPLYVFMKQTSCFSWLDEVLDCVCFLHPFPKTNDYVPPARAATPLGCRPLSFVYQVFQVFWQDDVFVDLGSAVQVIYLTRNAESRYFQCTLGLSCMWPRRCFCLRSGASDDLLPWYDKAFAIFFSYLYAEICFESYKGNYVERPAQSKSRPLICNHSCWFCTWIMSPFESFWPDWTHHC